MIKIYKDYIEAEDKQKFLKELKEKDEKMGYRLLTKGNLHIEYRNKEYPTIEEQLDILYHEGFEKWKNIISNTKNKYPKVKTQKDY